jgi:Protein of unknown function (DUF2630)
MADDKVQDQIEELVAEEHRLLKAGEGGGHDPERHARLEAVRVELDRVWDLLRQRRAREEFGLDPEGASQRDADTVEGYEQ